MSKKATNSIPTRTPHDVLAKEAADWDARRVTPAQFEDAPDAVPRSEEAQAISIRMPKKLLVILKKFAEREGIGYQVLMKKWLDDRVRVERDRMRKGRLQAREQQRPRAPRFPLVDRNDDLGHYQQV
jgi:predicted DNA binding CopG/RHH family protein